MRPQSAHRSREARLRQQSRRPLRFIRKRGVLHSRHVRRIGQIRQIQSIDPIISKYKYTYEPITTEITTRMLILHNGDYDDELVGDLELSRLDESAPPWEALSYAWGTSNTYSRIKIGGKFIKISANLGDALKRLRYDEDSESPQPGCRLWVDQVCINQEDIPERSQQVQLMYSIYDKAKEVLVWLGRAQVGLVKQAFFTLRLVASLKSDQVVMIRRDDSGALAPLLDQLKVLFAQPWFSRLWVVQEVGTRTPVTLYWGQGEIDFVTLSMACEVFDVDLYNMAEKAGIAYHAARKFYHSFVEDEQSSRLYKDFAYQLYRFNLSSGQKCLDPKDRVFALLGHYSAQIGPDKHRIMDADYSLTKAAVYQELAIRSLADAKSTFLLHAVQHNGKQLPTLAHISIVAFSCKEGQISIPSWVPDWDATRFIGTFCRARVDWGGVAGNHPLAAQVLRSQSTLQIQGFVFDTIENLSRPFLDDWDIGPNPRYASEESEHILLQIYKEICGHDIFNLEVDYHALESSALIAFLDTCGAGWDPPFYNTETTESSTVDILPKLALGGIAYLRWILPPGSVDIPSVPADIGYSFEGWQNSFKTYGHTRCFSKTADGYYALCPNLVEKGDVVAVLMGYETPFILRPTGDDFLLVGECYVHGIMQGQALTRLETGVAVLRDFNIL